MNKLFLFERRGVSSAMDYCVSAASIDEGRDLFVAYMRDLHDPDAFARYAYRDLGFTDRPAGVIPWETLQAQKLDVSEEEPAPAEDASFSM